MLEQVVKVFISYSWDSEDHQKKVLSLAQALRDDGIDCAIDQFVQSPDNWDRWMLDQIDESDFVLIVCSERYYQRYRGKEEIDKGLGVTWESTLIMGKIYDSQGKNSKFYPVFLTCPDKKIIPDGIRTSFYDLSEYDSSDLEIDKNRLVNDGGYKNLYRLLTCQPSVLPKKIGSLKKLEPIQRFSEESAPSTAPLSQDICSVPPSMLETDSKILQNYPVHLDDQETVEGFRAATIEQQSCPIEQANLLLSANIDSTNSYTLTAHLKLVISQGTPSQGELAVSLTLKWLEQINQNDAYVRNNCLNLARDKATLETAQVLLTQTYSWLSDNLERCDSYVMTAYLRLAIERGNIEQKQKAKEQAEIWLKRSDDSFVRTQYLKLLKNIG
jgi:SEFIR domain